jgi:hypothetical protein
LLNEEHARSTIWSDLLNHSRESPKRQYQGRIIFIMTFIIFWKTHASRAKSSDIKQPELELFSW